tara:strand:+ start:175 stop:1434 length:1260 start_codon:yes stop_codon:yes gene_type:complete
MKLLIGISIVFFVGLLSSSAFGETQHVDEKRNFSITLPDGWIVGEKPRLEDGFIKFQKDGDIEPFKPVIFVLYEKNYQKTPYFTSTMPWIVAGEYFEYYDAIPPEIWCEGWKYRPDGYTYDMHCIGIEELKNEYFNEGKNEIHEIDAVIVWESDWEDKSVIKKEQFFSKRITNGIDHWSLIVLYDHDTLYEFPNLDAEIKPILESFAPLLCNDKSSTRITLDGEMNPIIGSRQDYQITVENPMDRGSIYFDVYGIDHTQLDSKNKKNTHGSQSYDMRGSGDFFIKDATFHYLSSSFSLGESSINIANGCHLFQFPITIRDENWSETEVISVVPAWVKNNAGWWADGSIDDDAFIQAIQFLIKEEIISIDSVASSATESTKTVPAWVKNNAGWWAEGLISENDFLKGIKFMIQTGVISVS